MTNEVAALSRAYSVSYVCAVAISDLRKDQSSS
jgi:hypothetical protein